MIRENTRAGCDNGTDSGVGLAKVRRLPSPVGNMEVHLEHLSDAGVFVGVVFPNDSHLSLS